MEFLIIINTFTIIYILTNKHFSYSVDRSFGDTLLGINFYFKSEGLLYIPLRNTRKVEVKEDLIELAECSVQSRKQKLRAMFSWLDTQEEVDLFHKNYFRTEMDFVQELVDGFVPTTKTEHT